MEQRISFQQMQSEMLVKIALKNESLRKKFSEQLTDNASEVERLANLHINDQMQQELQKHAFMYMHD
jgi:hypothetical protein